MVLGHLDSYMKKKMKWPPTYTIHKKKLKMDKRLKYKLQHQKRLRGGIGRKISDIPHSNIFTNMSPRARDIKERINKWDLAKIKSFCMHKVNIIKINIFANDTSPLETSVWSLKYIKNSHNSTLRRQATQLKNGQRTWTDTSPRRTYRGSRDIWKDTQYC